MMLSMIAFGSTVNNVEASTCENCIWSGTHLVCSLEDVQEILGYVIEDCGTATPMSCFDFQTGWCIPD